MFHKEGYKIIAVTFILVIGFYLITDYYVVNNWLRWPIFAILGLFLIIILQFFRNPKRNTQLSEKTVTSPVDGKVVVIEEVYEPEFFKDKRLQVSVFMSPINVHVTRYPISGKVTYSKYHPGKYLVAWHPKASTENERTTVVVENETIGAVLYRQIAGALAKRIVNYATTEDKVIQGTDSGFIKFGSRVDLIVPNHVEIRVSVGDRVRAGETVMGVIQ